MDMKDNVYAIHLGNGFNGFERRVCFIILTESDLMDLKDVHLTQF